jgi:predicted NAD/FAD-dependent oxidoreductase
MILEYLMDRGKRWVGAKFKSWQVQRWRYSEPPMPSTERFKFLKSPAPIAVAGDAFGGPRVEGAFLSGRAAAEQVLIA